jgi:hypothetical protein
MSDKVWGAISMPAVFAKEADFSPVPLAIGPANQKGRGMPLLRLNDNKNKMEGGGYSRGTCFPQRPECCPANVEHSISIIQIWEVNQDG